MGRKRKKTNIFAFTIMFHIKMLNLLLPSQKGFKNPETRQKAWRKRNLGHG